MLVKFAGTQGNGFFSTRKDFYAAMVIGTVAESARQVRYNDNMESVFYAWHQ
jgi:hypothetical protein